MTKSTLAIDNYEAEKWDFNGIREDAELMFEVGYILANTDWWPTWNRDSEFRSKRERDRNSN